MCFLSFSIYIKTKVGSRGVPATEYVDLWERTPDDAVVYIIWDDNRLNGLGSTATPCQKQDRVTQINAEYVAHKKAKKKEVKTKNAGDESEGDDFGEDREDPAEGKKEDKGKKRDQTGQQKEFDAWLVEKKYKPHLFATVAEFRFCRSIANAFEEFGDVGGGWPEFRNLR